MNLPHPLRTRAHAIVASGFAALRPCYLVELQLVAEGLPMGPLLLASGLGDPAHHPALFAAAADPRAARWQAHFAQQLGGDLSTPREAWLAWADEALAGRRYRRATQLYGWLLLTSQRQDNAMHSALQHLQGLRHHIYGV